MFRRIRDSGGRRACFLKAHANGRASAANNSAVKAAAFSLHGAYTPGPGGDMGAVLAAIH